MSTIKDVAKKAGVSVGTASRVLSNNQSVKQKLRDRVLAAVEELQFRPNLAARALRTNRIDVIGLIVPDITNPFFAQLAKCIETEAAKRNHSVILANSHDDAATESKQLRALLDHTPRGVIIAAASDSSELGFQTDVPIISVDRRFADCKLISTDHADGSAKIADYLFSLGHRRIAYVAGPQNTEVGRVRKDGFVTKVEELNKSSGSIELRIFDGQFDFQSGEEIGREILADTSDWRPTAIAAANDQLAIGVLRTARDLRIDVPNEISITGFDDILLASLVVPRLTTIRQPIEQLSKTALDGVFTNQGSVQETPLQGEIIIRGSTARPK